MSDAVDSAKRPNNQKTINDLCGAENSKKYNFIIPAYQRGYRWTPDQVNDLLNDIDENPKNKQYCLQPLVVKADKNTNSFELIDGQQRLTTIYLILCALSAPKINMVFSLATERTLRYKSIEVENENFKVLQSGLDESVCFFDALKKFVARKNNEENDVSQASYNSFFEKLQDNEAYENIDRFYLLQAMNIILKHYYDKEGNFKINGITADTLVNRIKENFYFLWYETGTANDCSENDSVEHEDSVTKDCKDTNSAEAAFSRLNSGKIALNNADLIKALLLRRENLLTEDIKDADEKWLAGWLETQRAEIISQWDNMEQILRSDDDRFWNFIVDFNKLNDSSSKYFSRLEIIFDLQMGAERPQNDDFNQQYRIYRFFEKKVKEIGGSEKNKSITSEIWTETIRTFNIMREWYEDHELYHYIGYLSCLPIKYIVNENSAEYPSDFAKNKNLTSWIHVLAELVNYAGTHCKKDFSSVVKKLVRWTVLKQMKSRNVNDCNDLLTRLTYDKKNDEDASQDQSEKELIEDKELIKYLLLLCNIQELITSKNMREADHKFPFKMLKINTDKKLTLTLEHILPQKPEFTASNNQDKTVKELRDICKNLHEQLTKYGIIKDEYQDSASADAAYYKDYIEKLWDKANPPGQKMNAQRFYNLALLPHGTNASLSNHIFPEKRDQLLEATKEQYIPLSTQNVFLKRYSWRKLNRQNNTTDKVQANESPLFWLESDAVAYREEMVNLLSEFELGNE